MSLLVPDKGERQLLEMALKKTTVEAQIIKLFVNNYTPDENSTELSFTEMSTHGYVAKMLNRADWTIATAVGVSSASNLLQTWTFTAAPTVWVYGYYIIEATSGIILWAERFTESQAIANDGDQIKITPRIEGS